MKLEGIMLPVFLVFIPMFLMVAGWIDTALLIRFGGPPLKRGFRLYKEPLAPAEREFLERVGPEIVEMKKLLFREFRKGFLKKSGTEVLIQSRKEHWSTGWPLVGYIDLSRPTPEIEYRGSLLMHLVLYPFVVVIITAPFVLGMLYLSFRMERSEIKAFLERQMQERIS